MCKVTEPLGFGLVKDFLMEVKAYMYHLTKTEALPCTSFWKMYISHTTKVGPFAKKFGF